MKMIFALSFLACVTAQARQALSTAKPTDVHDSLGITEKEHVSAGSKRAIDRIYKKGPGWDCHFLLNPPARNIL